MIQARMKDAIRRMITEMLREPAIKRVIEDELEQLRSCHNCPGCKKLAFANPSLSRLIIDKECRILLADYNYLEVKIHGSQAKSLYLLYVLTEQGIANANLKLHEAALIKIYKEVCKGFSCDDYRAEEIIKGLIYRPSGISDANNKIRKAIYEALPSNKYVREYYLIFGMRNQTREIRLPKELITIENEALQSILQKSFK